MGKIVNDRHGMSVELRELLYRALESYKEIIFPFARTLNSREELYALQAIASMDVACAFAELQFEVMFKEVENDNDNNN